MAAACSPRSFSSLGVSDFSCVLLVKSTMSLSRSGHLVDHPPSQSNTTRLKTGS
eukprot:m.33579 g.33579  ORF g.33579 m.33579 type:complete len:54 (+) comp7219_c0_seq1:2303-2464(+)